MKRVLTFSVMIAAMIVVASCSSSSGDSPSKALNGYIEMLQSRDYENFVEGFALGEDITPEQAKQQKAMLSGLVGDKVSKEYDKRGGLKGVEFITEEISEDGNSAVVTFKMQFGDGTEQEDSQDMVKRDGKWLMDADK